MPGCPELCDSLASASLVLDFHVRIAMAGSFMGVGEHPRATPRTLTTCRGVDPSSFHPLYLA